MHYRIPAAAAALFCLPLAFAQRRPAQDDNKEPVKLYIPYEKYSQADNERILELYKDLRVADVTDGMDVVGLQDTGIMSEEIKALWRDTDNFTHRVVGIAV